MGAANAERVRGERLVSDLASGDEQEAGLPGGEHDRRGQCDRWARPGEHGGDGVAPPLDVVLERTAPAVACRQPRQVGAGPSRGPFGHHRAHVVVRRRGADGLLASHRDADEADAGGVDV